MDHADRIRKLLAKADSTTFPAEAAALREKAKQLQARYGDEPQRRWQYDPGRIRGSRPSRVIFDEAVDFDPDLVTRMSDEDLAAANRRNLFGNRMTGSSFVTTTGFSPGTQVWVNGLRVQ